MLLLLTQSDGPKKFLKFIRSFSVGRHRVCLCGLSLCVVGMVVGWIRVSCIVVACGWSQVYPG